MHFSFCSSEEVSHCSITMVSWKAAGLDVRTDVYAANQQEDADEGVQSEGFVNIVACK